MASVSDTVSTIAQVATAAGVAMLGVQLWLSRKQQRAEFERTFVTRYESIIGRIPLALILGEEHSEQLPLEQLHPFFDYFELCEEELYYRRVGKVTKGTWRDWEEGMSLNFRRPAFREAWEILKDATQLDGSAKDLQRSEQFKLLRLAASDLGEGRAYDPRRRWRWLGLSS